MPDEVLKAAVDYSIQYIPQRSLPDKAIDLVDVTAAHLAAQHPVTDVMLWNMKLKKKKLNKKLRVAKEDYEAVLMQKFVSKNLKRKFENHTEDHKVTATINDVG